MIRVTNSRSQEIEGEAWIILSGVLTVLIGLFILAGRLSFGLMFVHILGVFAIIEGTSLILYPQIREGHTGVDFTCRMSTCRRRVTRITTIFFTAV